MPSYWLHSRQARPRIFALSEFMPLRRLTPHSSLVSHNSYRDVLDTLQTGAIAIWKINLSEFQGACAGLGLLFDRDRPSSQALRAAAGSMMRRFGLRCVALTDGSRPAHLFCREPDGMMGSGGVRCWRYTLPVVEPVNAIGCGDTVAAGLHLGWLAGLPPHEAFALGLAAATVACQTDVAAGFARTDVASMLGHIQCEELLQEDVGDGCG